MRNTKLAAAGLVLLMAAVGAGPEGVRTVTTTGEAVVYVVPDEVVVRLGVQVVDADLDKAVAEASQKSERLVGVIRGMKVEEGDLSTTALSIYSRTLERDGKRGEVEYTVSRTYRVRLKDVAGFSKFVQACLKGGANEMEGFEFRSSQDREKRDEARRLAARAAKEKAELLAGELGAKVGMVREIREEGARLGRPAYANFASVNEGGGGGDDLPGGKIEIRASVTVSFELQ